MFWSNIDLTTEQKNHCCAAHGSWFTVHGSWFTVHGSWFMVHGTHRASGALLDVATGQLVKQMRSGIRGNKWRTLKDMML